MNLIPLLARELQTALRRAVTLRLRIAFGGASMIVAVWSLLISARGTGRTVFEVLVGVAALLAVFVGIFVASDSLARERREGTLDLLLLTDLRPGEVILGKFVACSLVPVYTLLSMFPALALSQLIGGVPAAVFWRGIASLLIALIFSLSATIYVSSRCEDHRKAYAGAALLLMVANPLWNCWAALFGGVGGFLILALFFCGLAILFLHAAAVRLENRFRDDPTVRRNQPREGRKIGASRALLDSFPVAWMMLRRRETGIAQKWLAGFAGVIIFALLLPRLGTAGGAGICLAILFLLHLGYQLVMMTRTAYAFYRDRQNGALELLLCSPLSNAEIFEGLNQYLLRQSGPTTALFSGINVVCATLMWLNGFTALAAVALAMALTLWITLLSLGWLGVYRSLMMHHPSLAMLATYARLSLVPVILSLIFMVAPGSDLTKVAIFYLVSAGFLAAFFSMDAKAALEIHGRTLLLRPHSEGPPHIESEWSFIDWENEESSTVKWPDVSHESGLENNQA